MTDKTKDKSVKDTLKSLGATTLPKKPGTDLRKDMQKLPGKPGEDLRDGMVKLKEGGSTGNWIKKAIKKPGALRKSLGVPTSKKISPKKLAAAAKKPGKMGQRARLAQTLKKMK